MCTIIHMGMSQKWAPTIPMVIIMFPIKWQFLGVRNFEANPTSYCWFYLYSVISPFSLGKSCLKYPKIDIPRYEPYYEIYHQFTIIYHNVPEFTIVYHNLCCCTVLVHILPFSPFVSVRSWLKKCCAVLYLFCGVSRLSTRFYRLSAVSPSYHWLISFVSLFRLFALPRRFSPCPTP